MTWLLGKVTGALAGAWGYIAAAGGMILAVLVVLFQAKKAGKNEVIVETKEKEIENVQKANEVEREVAVSKPDARRERLRDKWTRD
jgi:ABC-type protease/lipase transport system fused ATPase/permease subunit